MIDTLVTFAGLPIFDVRVDGQYLADEGKTQLHVHTLSVDDAGDTVADLATEVVTVTVPSLGYEDDTWSQSNEVDEDDREWPIHIRRAFDYAVETATDLFFRESGDDPRHAIGDEVYLYEHEMPGTVVALTQDGAYVVNMAGAGVYDVFEDREIGKYRRTSGS